MHFLTESVAIGGLVSCELPRDFRRLRGLSQAARAHSVLLTMVGQLHFRRRYVTDRFQQPAMVEPVDPFQGRVFHGLQLAPRSGAENDFRFVQPDGARQGFPDAAKRDLLRLPDY